MVNVAPKLLKNRNFGALIQWPFYVFAANTKIGASANTKDNTLDDVWVTKPSNVVPFSRRMVGNFQLLSTHAKGSVQTI